MTAELDDPGKTESGNSSGSLIRVEFIRKFICQSCNSGWDDINDGFKHGTCACCGAPAGKLDALKTKPVEVDLLHSVLAMTAQHPLPEVTQFIHQARQKQIKVVSFNDFLPPEMPYFQTAEIIEKAVNASFVEIAFLQPGFTKDKRMMTAIESCKNEMDHFFIPFFYNREAWEETPRFIRSTSGSSFDPNMPLYSERGYIAPEYVIKHLPSRLLEAEDFYARRNAQ